MLRNRLFEDAVKQAWIDGKISAKIALAFLDVGAMNQRMLLKANQRKLERRFHTQLSGPWKITKG